AYEKAGIIKDNTPVIVYKQCSEAREIIQNICNEKNARCIEIDFDNINIKKSDTNSQIYDCAIMGEEFKGIEIKLIGEHQINNSILALNVIKYLKDNKELKIDNEDIKRGLLNTQWPGRIEKISENPMFII
ncbi:MAG: bifunctional folylpolyglutamate synthase/dihydrofolate synthase, partial [Peptostreptococcaceae bacterium]